MHAACTQVVVHEWIPKDPNWQPYSFDSKKPYDVRLVLFPGRAERLAAEMRARRPALGVDRATVRDWRTGPHRPAAPSSDASSPFWGGSIRVDGYDGGKQSCQYHGWDTSRTKDTTRSTCSAWTSRRTWRTSRIGRAWRTLEGLVVVFVVCCAPIQGYINSVSTVLASRANYS